MRLLAVIAVVAAALVVTATASTAGTARNVPHHALSFLRHSEHATSRLAAGQRTTTPKKAAPFKCISACSAYESTINQYFTDVAADSAATTNVYAVSTQYSNIQYSVTFGGSYVDGNPYPTTNTCQTGVDTFCVTDAQLQTEIGKVIAKNHWPKFSPTALYFIFTPANVGICVFPGVANDSNLCTTNVFCAYHSAPDDHKFIYAVEPDAAAIGVACDAIEEGPGGTLETPAGNSADATISTVSHEHNEAITDPFGDAWYSDDTFHPENGDLCAYNFGTPLGGAAGAHYNQVINGHNYWTQLEYSNEADSGAGGCVPSSDPGAPVTAPHPGYGVGPLVDHGGDVMTTNTVYAIYWVPVPPANTTVPAVSGSAKVGKKLKASHGTWANEPKYTYQWLRCSAAGTSCKGIKKATRSSYTLVTADKGHRIAARVTATNMMGHRSAISAPTARTKK